MKIRMINPAIGVLLHKPSIFLILLLVPELIAVVRTTTASFVLIDGSRRCSHRNAFARTMHHYETAAFPSTVIAVSSQQRSVPPSTQSSRSLRDMVLYLSLKPTIADTTSTSQATDDSAYSSFSVRPNLPLEAIDETTTTTSVEDRQPQERQSLEPIVYYLNKVLIDMVYNIICSLYPVGDGTTKHISSGAFVRFYVLETVARVPYFAYLSVLHLRETFGERTYSSIQENRLRTHYAEADNELHHLLIMESLGGNHQMLDRILAQSMAFVYYWYVVLVYSIVSTQAAYHLSELIEDHAYHTYNDFLTTYENELRQLPVPEIAKQYYLYDYPSFFPLFCTTATTSPTIELNSLYDVFVCIRNDEKEHWKTLCNLVQYDQMSANSHSPATTIESTQPKV
jgi:ubiquinol oxidase